jgi:hypothetical protein
MVDPQASFVKTPKGIEEIERKTHGLHLKARQVLIMIDGKRDQAALEGIFPPEMVPAVLEELLANGYVRLLDRPKPPPSPVAKAVPTAQLDGEDPFDLSRTFMINIARKILGIAGNDIVAKIDDAPNIEALRALFPEWRKAVVQSPDGLMRIKEFEFKLFQVLGDVSAVPAQAVGAAAPAPVKPKLPPGNDDERLVLARNFMVNTARNYLGIVADSLVPRFEAARSLTDLRQQFFDWREALQQSPEAKRRLAEFESKLAALLS